MAEGDVANTIEKQEEKTQVAETNGSDSKVEAPAANEDSSKSNGAEANGSDAKENHKSAEDVDERSDDDSRRQHRRDGKERGRGGFRGRGGRGGRGGGFQHKSKGYDKHNIKSKFENLPETDDPEQIREQVQFYFSDGNLLEDTFLNNEIGGPENKWVDIKMIANFSRMKRFQPFSAVVKALKDSDLLEVNDKDQVRRKVPLDKEMNFKTYDSTIGRPRSIYAKGFGDETSTTQTDIESFFKPYGPFQSVRLRRHGDGKFKGSVFVEFNSEETQKAFLELDPKPKYNGNELIVKSKTEYCDEKAQLIREGKLVPNENYNDRRSGGYRGRGGDKRRGHDRRRSRSPNRRDRDDWRGRRDDFQKRGRDGDRDKYGRDKRSRDQKEPEAPAVELDADGVPVIKATAPEPSKNGAKRGAEDEAGSPEAKRTKAEVEA